jgi:hypothetical protein
MKKREQTLEDWPFPYERYSEEDPLSVHDDKVLTPEQQLEIRQKALEHETLEPPETEPDYQLAENVAEDVIKYIRSNTIKNEEQFLLLVLAYVSGLSPNPEDYISTVTIGTSSSGKSHLKQQADELFEHCNVMDASAGSDKALIYDDEWDKADFVSMGELQQPSDEMLEFMKRAHGGDGKVTIKSTRGNPAEGFHTKTIEKESQAYHFTYAQFDADFEFWNRLLTIPVHESESKNRAVGRMAFGNTEQSKYGYEFTEGTRRLQQHMLDVKQNTEEVRVPDVAWDVVEPIFNHSRSESNRIYKMVRNLIKASARLNYKHRESNPEIIASAQDICNVIRCLDTLRATTHEIGPRKRAVVEAIKATSGDDNTIGGLEPVIEYLDESDASQVNLTELENIVDELENDHLVTLQNGDITVRNWDSLGEPNIEPIETDECIDPMDGSVFTESWQEYRQESVTTAKELVEQSSNVEQTALEEHEAYIAADIADTLDGETVESFEQLQLEQFITETEMFDPAHELWQQPDKPDDWVISQSDTRRIIQETVKKLIESGTIQATTVGDQTQITVQ